jgi:hypothetical protein
LSWSGTTGPADSTLEDAAETADFFKFSFKAAGSSIMLLDECDKYLDCMENAIKRYKKAIPGGRGTRFAGLVSKLKRLNGCEDGEGNKIIPHDTDKNRNEPGSKEKEMGDEKCSDKLRVVERNKWERNQKGSWMRLDLEMGEEIKL